VSLILYSTDGCHLCEEAEALLQAAARERAELRWRVVDIASDDQLFERYGWLIPVLASAAGTELRWPFDAGALDRFLAAELSDGFSCGSQ
jgi:hypothetical protein